MEPSPNPKEITSRYEKLLVALVTAGVDFAVVGGLAVIFNGYPRMTADADIVVGDSPENLRNLLNCLCNWGDGFARELKIEDFAPQEGAIRVMEDFDLDIFTRMMGKTLEDFRPRLRYVEVGPVRLPYLSPEDLVALKKHSWREKDKFDVAAMAEIITRERRTTT
jgi:hypothetical protein